MYMLSVGAKCFNVAFGYGIIAFAPIQQFLCKVASDVLFRCPVSCREEVLSDTVPNQRESEGLFITVEIRCWFRRLIKAGSIVIIQEDEQLHRIFVTNILLRMFV
jgi:hypothetical protein